MSKAAKRACIAGNEELKKGNYQQALLLFQKAIDIEPNNHLGYFFSGNAKHAQGKYQEAIEDYSKSIKCKPDDPYSYSSRSHSNYELKRYSDAVEDLKKAIEIDQLEAFETSCYLLRIGSIKSEAGDKEGAMKNFIKAIRLCPSNPDSYHFIGSAKYKAGDYLSAVNWYSECIEIDPESRERSSTYYYLGHSLFKISSKREAIQSFFKASSLGNTNADKFIDILKKELKISHIKLGALGDWRVSGYVTAHDRDMNPFDFFTYDNIIDFREATVTPGYCSDPELKLLLIEQKYKSRIRERISSIQKKISLFFANIPILLIIFWSSLNVQSSIFFALAGYILAFCGGLRMFNNICPLSRLDISYSAREKRFRFFTGLSIAILGFVFIKIGGVSNLFLINSDISLFFLACLMGCVRSIFNNIFEKHLRKKYGVMTPFDNEVSYERCRILYG